MDIQVVGATDIGSLREENEDSFGTLELDDAWFLTVCDGMGGYAGGKLASQTAVDALLEYVKEHHDSDRIAEVLEAAVHEANRAVRAKAKADERVGEMGTTCVAVMATEESFWVAHVGDSRAYRLRDGVYTLLTEDHTVVQQLVNQGRIDPIEAANHPSAGILVRCLGQLDHVGVALSGPHPLEPGDRLLICSDGLSGMLYEDDIARVLAGLDLSDAMEALLRYANDAGGFDNITVVGLAAGPLPEGASSWNIAVDSPEGKALAALEARGTTARQVTQGAEQGDPKRGDPEQGDAPEPDPPHNNLAMQAVGPEDNTRELTLNSHLSWTPGQDWWKRILVATVALALLIAALALFVIR